MAEPSSTAALAAGAFGAGLAGVLAGIDSGAAIGALCGSLVFFATTEELPVPRRLIFFMISLVMGYLATPWLAEASILGVGPIKFSAPAAFIASALVVTVTLAVIKRRQSQPTTGGLDG